MTITGDEFRERLLEHFLAIKTSIKLLESIELANNPTVELVDLIDKTLGDIHDHTECMLSVVTFWQYGGKG